MRPASILLAAILVVDLVLGVVDLFGLQDVRSAGISWVTWRFERAAIIRAAAALVVLLTLLLGSLYRNFALFLYLTLKCLLSIVVVLLVSMKAASFGDFVGRMASHGNWWHPLSTVVFGAAAFRLVRGRWFAPA